MGGKIFKLTIVLVIVAVVVYVLAQATGGSATVRIGKRKRKHCRRRRKHWNGERWQPQGVQGPMCELSNVFQPPLAPVNPGSM